MQNLNYSNLPIDLLTSLQNSLKYTKNDEEKIQILKKFELVTLFFQKHPEIKEILNQFSKKDQFILLSLISIGQFELILQLKGNDDLFSYLSSLLLKLEPVEQFYNTMGGLIGYHTTTIRLMDEVKSPCLNPDVHYLKPIGFDIVEMNDEVKQAIEESLKHLDKLVEIYPVGGAGDRLMLIDEISKEPLPTAQLQFDGYTLLEGLIRDLQAKEHLYFLKYQKKIEVPIIMMTSEEKNNEQHILSICEKNHWFHRKKENFYFIKQPLVPVITDKGLWAVSESKQLILKPGGHGVLWKLLTDSKIIDSLLEKGKTKALVRQINNPIAGLDYGLLAFTGLGFHHNKLFGFASCPRRIFTAEGMNVLVEKKEPSEFSYALSNIEYTDFVKNNIEDVPESEGSSYSAFPANTNILFADLKTIKQVSLENPVPGMLINMKSQSFCMQKNGAFENVSFGRLESLMQNIADTICDHFKERQTALTEDSLKTFLTYNERKKTISVTKKMYVNGQSIMETPIGAYYDKLENTRDLLLSCGMQVPEMKEEKLFCTEGPSFIVSYHPALGPIYEMIREKIKGGILHQNSELKLEIADLSMKDVDVKGSLLVYGKSLFDGYLCRCELDNVTIENLGIDRDQTKDYWKGHPTRSESLTIILQKNSVFEARNVTFKGSQTIEVQSGYKMTAFEENNHLKFSLEKITP